MALSMAYVMMLSCAWAVRAQGIEQNFANPPDSARPWVYWFWLNGNVTRQGITADLEAMKQAGIGGVLIMDVDQGASLGPVAFGSPAWRKMFGFACSEAHRLALEINMTNDAGWCGSGGPWVTPALSMQKVVWTETPIQGSGHVDIELPQPKSNENYYDDIRVLAVTAPADDSYRIPDIQAKAGFKRGATMPSGPDLHNIPPSRVIPLSGVTDVTNRVHDGVLSWDVPPGRWIVFRFGHTSTGVMNHPAPKAGLGLETDKLSRLATERQFSFLMAKLLADNSKVVGSTLVRTHIDSWETGTQNWTPLMSQEFMQRNGYDLLPYLPVLTGRVVGTVEISERFLWDYRRTLADMLDDNYAGRMEQLARARGIGLSTEAYGDCLTKDMEYGGRADEPMGEGGIGSKAITEMTSSGHIYGHPIIGAESFTVDGSEKWLTHPALIKNTADWEFCEGINRLVIHRFAMQPWLDRAPGMSMGPWGLHYERTQTWWKQSLGWHKYVARCQYLLRQGVFVADICYLLPEGAPSGDDGSIRSEAERLGYNYDLCTPEVLMTRVKVLAGRLVLPDGVSYKLLVLPKCQSMTVPLLVRIKQLVEEGATVLGLPPVCSASLIGYPQCDDQVKLLAARIWGDADGKTVFEHRLGQGVVIAGRRENDVLSDRHIPVDFSSGPDNPFRYTHRHTSGGADIYFISNRTQLPLDNVCVLRIGSGRPRFYDPESGRITPVAYYEQKDGVTRIPVRLEASQSIFVVFDNKLPARPSIIDAAYNRQTWPPQLSAPKIIVANATYGLTISPHVRDMRAKVQSLVDSGKFKFPVADLAASEDPAPNIVKTVEIEYAVGGQICNLSGTDAQVVDLLAQVPSFDPAKPPVISVKRAMYGLLSEHPRVVDVTQKVQALLDKGVYSFRASLMAAGDDPAPNMVKTLTIDFKSNDKAYRIVQGDWDSVDFRLALASAPDRTMNVEEAGDGKLTLNVWKSGLYRLTNSVGRIKQCRVPNIPAALPLAGPWQVAFPAQAGSARKVRYDKLGSWSEDSDSAIRYFSGTAQYTLKFNIPAALVGPNRLLDLDLGNVQVMADVTLNGKPLGVLWKPPYRIDITGTALPGANALSIRVTNLWVNRMIGDEQLPEDSDRSPSGMINAWPMWLQAGKPSPTGRITFTSWRLWNRDSPLQPSGLLGPVTLVPGYCCPIVCQPPK